MASFKTIHNLIIQDLSLLEKSNLRQANPKKYEELKNRFEELDKKVIYQEQESTLTLYGDSIALLQDWASISANFEFHMKFLGGYEEVANYQINQIKSNLENILNSLNDANYEAIEIKLDEYLRLCEESHLLEKESVEVRSLIDRIEYQIYKYHVKNKTSRKKENDAFLPFILDDINSILQDNEVSEILKEELKKYLLDVNLIIKNFKKVVMLINLGIYQKNVAEEEINNTYEFYSFDNIFIEYAESPTIVREIAKCIDIHSHNEASIMNGFEEQLKQGGKEYIVEYFIKRFLNHDGEEKAIAKIIEYNFTDIKYLFEAILSYILEKEFPRNYFHIIMNTKEKFNERGKNYDYELDCAIIAYKKRIPLSCLLKYAIKNHNEYIKAYVLEQGFDKLIREYRDYNEESTLDGILRLLYTVGKTEDIINVIKQLLYGITDHYVGLAKILKIISDIPNESIKKEVYDILYTKVDAKENPFNALTGYLDFCGGKPVISKLNTFDAHILSSKRGNIGSSYNVLEFVKQFYQANLNWANILSLETYMGLSRTDREEVLYYLYKASSEEFFKLVKDISSNLALKIVTDFPNSITEFINHINTDDIIKLPKSTLDIFCESYKKKLEMAGISIKDQINNTLSNAEYMVSDDIKKLLTYIMNEGILSDDVVIFKDNIFGILAYNPLIIEAIKNSQAPYLRAYYLNQFYETKIYEGENLIFLTDQEMNALEEEKNEEKKYMQKRTYYGSLLKVFLKVSVTSQKRIVILIAKSNIEEFIIYLYKNHSEYIDLLLQNVNNQSLYQRIVSGNIDRTGEEEIKR